MAAPANDDIKRTFNTGYIQWDIYNNITNAFLAYRGIKQTSATLEKEAFIKNMHFDNYVKIEGTKDKTKYTIALLERNERGQNDIVTVTEKFKLFINNIKSAGTKIYIISPCAFQTHVINYIIGDESLSNTLELYNYNHFKTIIPLGPWCSKHRLLSEEEASQVLKLFNIDKKEMKKIFMHDPQVVWLGGEPNQIVEIQRINTVTGYGTDYRRVVRSSTFGSTS